MVNQSSTSPQKRENKYKENISQNPEDLINDEQLQLWQELDKNIDNNFQCKLSQMIELVNMSKVRTFSQEVDLMENWAKKNNCPQNKLLQWVEKGLRTNFEKGLDESDFEVREKSYGHNRRQVVTSKSFCSLFFDAMNDFTLKILIVCAFLSIFIQMLTADDHERSTAWIEGFAILVAVLVCSTVAAGNDYQKEKQFQELNKVSDNMKKVGVYRNGKLVSIHRDDIYTGDIIQLVNGMELPADGIVIEGNDVTTDESVMTGEPDPVAKATLEKCIKERERIKAENTGENALNRHEVPSPILMSGTTVLSGDGKFLVTVIGKNSCQGEIEEKLKQKEDPATPLQMKLEVIANDIGLFGLYSAILIIIVLLIRFTIERISEGEFEWSHLGEILDFFIIGVTVVVVAIPEGLPLSVTLSLAFSTKKMLSDKNLVRKLQACETMGGANNICSDKTGTLTMNKMELTQVWNMKDHDIDTTKEQLNLDDLVNQNIKDIFLQSIAVNNTAEITDKKDQNGKIQQVMLGSATELAFLKYLKKCSLDWNEYSKKFEVTHKIPFSSVRKMMSRVIIVDGKRRLLVKGASEIVLAGCSYIHEWESDKKVAIDQQKQDKIQSAIKEFADKAMRTICLAYKDLGSNENDVEGQDAKGIRDVEKSDLVLVAICGIRDNLRDGVPEAVLQCQKSGITVRMVTGDNPHTAKAIAKNCNIFKEGDTVILGEDFMAKVGPIICKLCRTVKCDCPLYIEDGAEEDKEENEQEKNKKKQKQKEKEELQGILAKEEKLKESEILNQKQDGKGKEKVGKKKKKAREDVLKNQDVFREIYEKITVMARSRPVDKYAFVLGLIEEGQVVAVTGDGTNDSPALKKADVGFAMGIAGTQVAKNASDIILTDDNFSSIVRAVLWGRNIYDSIRKFLQFQLTVNVVAVVVTLIGAAISKQDFLKPIQMLWVNLIMDTFASLALATEPPDEKLLDRPPHRRDDYIISKKMFKHIIFQSIYQLIVVFFVAYWGEHFIKEYIDEIDEKEDFLVQYKYNLNKFNYNEYYEDKVNDNLYVASGRDWNIQGTLREYSDEADILTPSRHFTFLFNVFVMMQVFNFLNARKIEDEYNIFHRMFNNPLFFLIMLIIICLQVIFITFGGTALHCYKHFGLHWDHWVLCILFALGGNIVSLLIKPINENKLLFCKSKQKEETKGQDDVEAQQQKRSLNQSKKLSMADSKRRKSSILDLRKEHRRLTGNMGSVSRKFSNVNKGKNNMNKSKDDKKKRHKPSQDDISHINSAGKQSQNQSQNQLINQRYFESHQEQAGMIE